MRAFIIASRSRRGRTIKGVDHRRDPDALTEIPPVPIASQPLCVVGAFFTLTLYISFARGHRQEKTCLQYRGAVEFTAIRSATNIGGHRVPGGAIRFRITGLRLTAIRRRQDRLSVGSTFWPRQLLRVGTAWSGHPWEASRDWISCRRPQRLIALRRHRAIVATGLAHLGDEYGGMPERLDVTCPRHPDADAKS